MGEETGPAPQYGTPDWDGMERLLNEHDSPEPSKQATNQHRFSDTRTIARWVIGMLAIVMVSRGVALATAWVYRSWFSGEARPEGSSHLAIENLSMGANSIVVLFSVVTAILWVIWLWLSYSNLPGLKRGRLYRRFWVWLGWLVPIWNLFRPKEIHNEVWRSGGEEWIPFWFHLWWFLFLASLVASQVVSATEYTWADVVANALWIVAAIPAMAVVWVSSTRQWQKGHPDETLSRTSVLARILPFGVALFSFGLATLLIQMPHSEELPPGTRIVEVLEIEPGECFTGDQTEGLGLMWVVDCSTPHTGESVGVVEIDAMSYPGFNTLAEFGTIGCWGAFYEYAGDTAENLDYLLDWYSPLQASWNEGHDKIVCTVSHIDGNELSASVADSNSRWIAFEKLREGGCYQFHEFLIAATEHPCTDGGWKVGTVRQYRNDPLLEFPGAGSLGADLACPSTMTLEPIIPTSESWLLGDRVSVCLTEEPTSA